MAGAGSAADPARPVRRRPVGLLSAVLAVLVAVGWAQHYRSAATALAGRYVRALAAQNLPFKAQTLTLQRAALAETDILPLYGTSELYCCAGNFNAGTFFFNAPTGFAVFNVGYPVTEDLFWAETFGALGNELRGRRLVVSDSAWFTSAGGISPQAYAHTYSPTIALVFAYDSPLPAGLRAGVARRMLAFPKTLAGQALLTAGLRDLAAGGWRGRAGYLLLDPVGRLAAWVAELRDAAQTVRELDGLAHPAPAVSPALLQRAVRRANRPLQGPPWWERLLESMGWQPRPSPSLFALLNGAKKPTPRPLRAAVPTRPATINWNAELVQATAQDTRATADNPFGVLPHQWTTCSDITPVGGAQCRQALTLFRSGRTNREAQVYPVPQKWVAGVETCTCWTDLNLEFQVLDAVGARPLAWLEPLQGFLADYTLYSAPARRVVYDRYLAIAHQDGIVATTFQTQEGDPLFIDSFGHLSQRGWVYADRLLNLFWHGQLGQVRVELARGGSVGGLFPPALNCPQQAWCAGLAGTRRLPGELSHLP